MNFLQKFLIAGCLFVAPLAGVSGKDYEVDIQKKLQDCRDLAGQGLKYVESHSLEESCHAFLHDTKWRRGEIGVFIFDEGGICYIFGQETSVIWKDFQHKETIIEDDFIAEMIKVGKAGGLVDYKWDNAHMQSFVRTFKKDGKTYIIGAGFFPSSAEYRTQKLVEGAVHYAATHSAKQLFENINNPLGIFIQGDIYLYVYDMAGNVAAHGESPELINQNVMDQMTVDGQYRTRDIINLANQKAGKGWYTYASRQGGAEKRSYVEQFTDPKTGKKYVVVGGYYPTVDDASVQALVKKAGNYLRANGAERSLPEFTKKTGDFTFGSINIFVYKPDGTMLADSDNPAFVGLNLINSRDAEGKYITRSVLEHAEKYPNGGWLGFSLRGSYAMVYVEKVSVPDGDFIIGASYYPSNKYIHVRFMVDKATQFLNTHEKEEAFGLFTSTDPDFLRGDISVFVYRDTGYVWVDGQKRGHVWQDNKDFKDDKGKLISDKIIAIATSGGGWFEFNKNNAVRRVYVKQVVKEVDTKDQKVQVETFIVGSGYYM